MNAPVHAALLAARAVMPAAPVRLQPTIPAGLQLLKTGYQHGPLYLDLYGSLDADGYEVVAVTLTGSVVDLEELVTPKQLADMSDWCDRSLPSAHALLLVSQYEARAERQVWARNCGWHPS